MKRGAGHPARAGARQVEDGFADVPGGAETQRVLAGGAGALLRGPAKVAGLDEAGKDGVDADAPICDVGRERDGEADETSLAGVVGGGDAGTADAGDLGADVDDGASLGREHGLESGAGAIEYAAQVDVDHPLPLGIGQVPGVAAGTIDAGVVDEDVEAAVGL